MTSFVLKIEPDDKPGNQGQFMVCIYREASGDYPEKRIGVPMRGVAYEKAREVLSNLQFAFSYGMDAMDWVFMQAAWRETQTSVESRP